MPGFGTSLSPHNIRKLAIFISEKRNQYSTNDFRLTQALSLPTGTIKSEKHHFTLETVTTGLDPWPYSIAPLPDGRILLAEKARGLSIISTKTKEDS
jgi:hypothetical protein